MADNKQFNLKNPAVKRILQEVKEMQRDSAKEYMSMPLEEDIFEWQFAIHGPPDTEFEGGIYHGRIILPAEYPFKPPAFMLLTPSGRFEVQTKICLTISQHHPEHWQPSWSVRTALVALIAFMPSKPDGALGSLDYTKEERRALAVQSRVAAPRFGSAERQKVINQMHEEMLRGAPPVPELKAATPLAQGSEAVTEDQSDEGRSSEPESEVTTEQILHEAEVAPASEIASNSKVTGGEPEGPVGSTCTPVREAEETKGRHQVEEGMLSRNFMDSPGVCAVVTSAELGGHGVEQRAVGVAGSSVREVPSTNGNEALLRHAPAARAVQQHERNVSNEERGLTMLAMALVVAILALLLRKFLKVHAEAGIQDPQSI